MANLVVFVAVQRKVKRNFPVPSLNFHRRQTKKMLSRRAFITNPQVCNFILGSLRVNSAPFGATLGIPFSASARLGVFENYQRKASENPMHFKAEVRKTTIDHSDVDYHLPHPIWTESEAEKVLVTHQKPVGFVDHCAYFSVLFVRRSFDLLSGYTLKRRFNKLNEKDVLRRCIFLETVAGVPGFAAAMIRHLHSLRRFQRDHGWIHTLLEEAENERLHLMTFLQLRQPGSIFRGMVIIGQIAFTGLFSVSYLISPHFCHRFVGYLEEQAVVTYTHILEEMDAGRLPAWVSLPAPDIAINYWHLHPSATMRDVILVIRADEDHHRHVNHTLGSMDLRAKNPFKPGE